MTRSRTAERGHAMFETTRARWYLPKSSPAAIVADDISALVRQGLSNGIYLAPLQR
jgi:hypothetical protein